MDQPAARRILRFVRTRRARTPPDTPPGWHVGPPDFVGVGAQKCGTSWWYALIAQHPDVHDRRAGWKELHFFDRFHGRVPDDAELDSWYRCFPRPPGGLAGEWTPIYMAQPWIPPLLARTAPGVRALVLLRDPVERYRSALTHERDQGRRVDREAMGEAFRRGLYGSQLDRLFACLGPERVLVLQYERCRADAASELARTFRFLGARPHDLPASAFAVPVNETRARKVDLPPGHREALVAAYRDEVEHVLELVPDLDRSLWPNFRT